MAVSQNTIGRRAEQDTPGSNEGLLMGEGENSPTAVQADGKKQNASKAAKTKKGPKYMKNGNVLWCVVMLDGHTTDFELDKAAKGQDLVDKACETLQLLEKDYFSCSYMVNDTRFWLNHQKKIIKQLKGQSSDFRFEVKFYPSDPQHMAEDITRYQLFLQVRTDVYTGKLPCSFMSHCLLGSLAAQSEFGDYDQEELGAGIQYLKDSAPYAPNQSEEMLEKICELHKTHRGLTPADAELTYLDNAKLMALYGVDLHKAKDKDESDVMVGVCSTGINVYKEKLRVHRFPWAKILTFAYKRNCFYIKNRPGESDKQNNNLVYKLLNYTMAKRLWKVAVEHHSFFRLKEAETPKRAVFPLFGSKFRYSGRTQFQTRNEASHIERKTPTIDRAASRKYAGNWKNYETAGPSYSTDRVEEVIMSGDAHTATLDLKNIRKNKGNIPATPTEDDRNLNAQESHDGSVSFHGTNYPTASYSAKQFNGTGGGGAGSAGGLGYQGQDSKFDQFGRPIPSMRVGDGGHFRTNGEHDDDLPPYQDDHFMMTGAGQGGRDRMGNQYSSSASTSKTTTTRTFRGTEGTVVTEHKTEKDGVVETRIEKKILITSNDDDYDYDKALLEAISEVTKMNPDLSVEKIEIRTERDQK